mmetsp:Transcript_25179/g.67274  ORF Transcript_25179/g.67274 Transcript_25179/m.67274 type:complete len:331 (-) Transcript_25179:87-1079(-)
MSQRPIARCRMAAPAVLSARLSTASSSTPPTPLTSSSDNSWLCPAAALKTSGPHTRLQKVRSNDCNWLQASSTHVSGPVSSFHRPRSPRCSKWRQAARLATASLPNLRQPFRLTSFRVSLQPCATASMAEEDSWKLSTILSWESTGIALANSSRLRPQSFSDALLVSSTSSVGATRPSRQLRAASSSIATLLSTTAFGSGSASTGTNADTSAVVRLQASCSGSRSSDRPRSSSRSSGPYRSRRFFMRARSPTRSSVGMRAISPGLGAHHSSLRAQSSTRPLGLWRATKHCLHRGHRLSLRCAPANCSTFTTQAPQREWPQGWSRRIPPAP